MSTSLEEVAMPGIARVYEDHINKVAIEMSHCGNLHKDIMLFLTLQNRGWLFELLRQPSCWGRQHPPVEKREDSQRKAFNLNKYSHKLISFSGDGTLSSNIQTEVLRKEFADRKFGDIKFAK
jgi:hypothetical protein